MNVVFFSRSNFNNMFNQSPLKNLAKSSNGVPKFSQSSLFTI